MSGRFKSPTGIRVTGVDTFTGKFLSGRFCELGYDVWLPGEFRDTKSFDKYYHVVWDYRNIHYFDEYHFKCRDYAIQFYPVTLYKDNEVSLRNFVDFTIYCWGCYRGDRLPEDYTDYAFKVVTPDMIDKWKLTE